MDQYLTAQWGYTAEGNYELSFNEGDKIKLLEKHNQDWWEGEINDEIGFFPANRTVPFVNKKAFATASSSHSTPKTTSINYATNIVRPLTLGATQKSQSNPYLTYKISPASTNQLKTISAPTNIPKAKDAHNKDNLLVDISTNSTLSLSDEKPLDTNELPLGWNFSYDNSGDVYFFNETTGESQWNRPLSNQSEHAKESAGEDDDDSRSEHIYDIHRIDIDALDPNWIRFQSSVQLKAIFNEGLEPTHWKDYYAVLAKGHLIIYEDGSSKTSRKLSVKLVTPYGAINLQTCEILPATRSEIRKKYAFTITSNDFKVALRVSSEALYEDWLDAIMSETVSYKEEEDNQDMDLVKLLNSISLVEKLKVELADTTKEESANSNSEDPKSSSTLQRWFSRSGRNSLSKSKHQKLADSASGSSPTVTQRQDLVFGDHIKLDGNGEIPLVIRACIEQVELRGLEVVGIYRLSGQTTSIQKYKKLFNSNPSEVDLSEEGDINAITGLLKLYFRELKNPLLTFEYYDRFIEAARLQDYDERMFRLKSIIQALPLANYKVLQYLMHHLENVKEQSEINKMESPNLALIFSINLLRSKSDDLSSTLLQNDLQSKVIETVIQHVDWFFDTDTDDDLMENSSH